MDPFWRVVEPKGARSLIDLSGVRARPEEPLAAGPNHLPLAGPQTFRVQLTPELGHLNRRDLTEPLSRQT